MRTGLTVLMPIGMLAFANASLASDTAWPCDDRRLPRVETFRREMNTPRGPGIVESSVRCRSEEATYVGPRGEGPATLITWTYSFWDLDAGASESRLFLITPDRVWREIPAIINTKFRPAGPDGRKWQLPPRSAAYSTVWGLLGGLSPSVFYSRLPPVAIEEAGDSFCFSYRLRYPFTGEVRGCSSTPTTADVGYDKNVLSLAKARTIAVEAFNARHVPPSANELNVRVVRIIDGDSPRQFRYEFWVDRVNDVAITVDGLSGKVRFSSRP